MSYLVGWYFGLLCLRFGAVVGGCGLVFMRWLLGVVWVGWFVFAMGF